MSDLLISPEGRVYLPGRFLRKLFLVREHYEARGERLTGFTGHGYQDSDEFEATIVGGRMSYAVKVRLSEAGVYEFGREEL